MADTKSLETPYQVVGLAASAGGIHALQVVLSGLPADFPVPVIVVQHLDPKHRSLLSEVLGRVAKLNVLQADTGEKMAPGNVYVAPPNRHLLVSSEMTVSLTDTEAVHFVRPSADLLFESMAEQCGKGAIAVVLSGTGLDGSLGIAAVRRHGGKVIAQDKTSSDFFGMPGASIGTGLVDYIVPLEEIAATLVNLVHGETA